MRSLRAFAFLVLACCGGGASASPFFDGTTGDVWVVDPETGRVVAYDFGAWVEEFAPSGTPRISLSSNEFALVNAVPGSSVAPTPGQPALSLADVGAAAIPGAFDAERPSLRIRPADGSYDGTIAVRLEVSSTVIRGGGAVLSWQVNGEAVESAALSVADLDGAILEEGYFARVTHLVRDGEYQVNAELSVNGVSRARAEARYNLVSTHPDGFRRDTDGDGIPDLVEAELGLDPFSDDWQALEADGWSRFDKWLRSRCLDEDLVPIETGDGCLDEDGLPIDTDADGWADFDERLRRTNPVDPEPLLAPEGEETAESEAFRQRVLRFKDFPAARRLYEPERVVTAGQLPTLTPEPWLDVTAASAVGGLSYSLPALLTEDELQAARLDPATVAARLQRVDAEARLAEGRLPQLRLGAGDSMIVAAEQFARAPDVEARRVFKAWLPRWPEVTPLLFREVAGTGTWETAAEWRRDFIRFLAARLAVEEVASPDAAGTALVSIMEGALGEEARVAGLQPLVLFAHPGLPVNAEFIQGVEAALDDLAETGADLDTAHAAIAADLAAGGPLQAVAAWLAPWIEAPPGGTRSDAYIAAQFQRSFDISCYLSEEERTLLQGDGAAWDAFLARCGEALDLARLQALLDEDAGRVYLARLFLLPAAAAALADDASVADALADSDLDGLENGIELSVPLDRIGLPWLADTDGDGVLDGADPCPVDPLDFCTGSPTRPGVRLDPEFSVFEPASGVGYALVGVELEREHSEPVTIFFETFIDAGDSATPGQDFVTVQGSVTIAPGQRVALVRIEIAGDRELEEDESFSVRITGIDGGVLAGAGTVRIVINDTPPEGGCAAGCFVGGEVQGLVAGSVLQLLLNDGVEELNLAAAGPFTFGTPLPDGSAFTVSIGSQPTSPPQDCLVQNGSGVINGADFPGVLVLCFPDVNLQATGGDAQVTLGWNAADFTGATFALCRAEEEPLAGFANCLSYTGGQLFENVSQPLVQSGLLNGRRYWYLLEVRHAQGVRTYSAPASAMPEAPPEPGASRLNDTGQRLCYGDAWTDCAEASTGDQAARPRQDGRFGRDAMAEAGLLAKIGGGQAGFDFTPLDAAGQPIAIVDGAPVATPVCVRDNVSGLIWEGKTPENASRNYTRSGAFNYASVVNGNGGLCGFTDWRLPDRRELFSIVNNRSRFAAFDEQYFPNTTPTTTAAATLYWANEVYNANPTSGWTITFANGNSTEQLASSLQKVRLVRGERFPQGDFRDNGDGTVTDLTNGLTWDKCSWGQSWDSGANTCSAVADAISSNWDGALTAAVTANEANHRGRRDWRLPNRAELESLLRLNANLPAIDATVFPNTAAVGYWSSTPYAISLDAWRVGFDHGRVSNAQMTLGNRIRLVRGGDDFDLLAPIENRLNDTGRTECFDGAGLADCIEAVAGDTGLFPQQDGRFGRDAQALAGQLSKAGGGWAGFDFTPLGSGGEVIELAGGAPASQHACVQDNVTGLAWEVKTAANAGNTYTWEQANTYAENLNNGGGLCGYSDWRMPTRRELLSIIDHGRSLPAVDRRFFTNTPTSGSSRHWTADADLSAPLGTRHWTVDFAFGDSVSGVESATSQLVLLVRGEPLPDASFRDNGDGTVTDLSTGLTWDKCAWGQSRDAATNQCGSPDEMALISWGEAIQVPLTANSQLHRGQGDWRLPNRTELESLFNLDRTFPAMETGGSPEGVFGNAPAGGVFWTATVRTADFTGPTVWFGDFDFGDSAGSTVSTFPPPLHGVRLVRGGDDFDALE